ncbi:hypothetical protein Taro_033708 [Colocasia esculenta]|uniref:Uncharacterized protein n=1 Tax=Colocasia esculenta TaxID=4460 RepID=A0A843W5I5_COLES|nr:hypothetical protein [Colocasia esculenta]
MEQLPSVEEWVANISLISSVVFPLLEHIGGRWFSPYTGFSCLGLEPNGSPLREEREDCRRCGRRSAKSEEDQGGPVEELGGTLRCRCQMRL